VSLVTLYNGCFSPHPPAPAARLILSKWFGVKDSDFHQGTSATR
jgi:hypothetical protein